MINYRPFVKSRDIYSLHPVLIDIFPYGTMIKIILINLLNQVNLSLLVYVILYWGRLLVSGTVATHWKSTNQSNCKEEAEHVICVGETPRWRLNTSIKFGFLNFGNISIKIGWREYELNMQIYWMDPCMWFYIFTLIWIWKYPEWTSQKRGKGGKHRFDRLSQIRSSIQVFNTNKVVGELFKYT